MDGITWDIIIAGIVLLLLIIRIFYALKSLRASALLEARKNHTAELIQFLKEWYDKFPIPKSATEPKTEPTPSAIIGLELLHVFPDIEKNWKYQDIIKYHLPPQYKTLPIKWEEYKKMSSEYGEMRNQLYEKIKEDVLSKTNLNYNAGGSEDHTISECFIKSLYMQYVTLIRNNRSCYSKGEGYRLENNTLWFGGFGLARGKEGELIQTNDIFEKMMFDKGYLMKYNIDILKIIECEKKVEDSYKEIKEMIEKLMGYSLLPGAKCDILKNI